MIKDLSNIRYNRAIVPEDAVSLDIDTIDTGDASQFLACAAIYVRFKRKCGNYSCQLLFYRTKLVPDGYSQPKAEIFACGLNASSGHVVALSLGDLHREYCTVLYCIPRQPGSLCPKFRVCRGWMAYWLE